MITHKTRTKVYTHVSLKDIINLRIKVEICHNEEEITMMRQEKIHYLQPANSLLRLLIVFTVVVSESKLGNLRIFYERNLIQISRGGLELIYDFKLIGYLKHLGISLELETRHNIVSDWQETMTKLIEEGRDCFLFLVSLRQGV